MAWRGTPSFELNAESKETKLQKKQWYVAHALCITQFIIFFFTEKIDGRRGSRIVYTPVKGMKILSEDF